MKGKENYKYLVKLVINSVKQNKLKGKFIKHFKSIRNFWKPDSAKVRLKA